MEIGARKKLPFLGERDAKAPKKEQIIHASLLETFLQKRLVFCGICKYMKLRTFMQDNQSVLTGVSKGAHFVFS